MLDVTDVVRMRMVSKTFLTLMSDDDFWMDKLTVLVLECPLLSDLDKGIAESCFQWFGRCYESIMDGRTLALRHKAGEQPFLNIYGTVDGYTFTPYSSPLRFPVRRGFVAEIIALYKAAGKAVYKDPAKDAVQLFEDAPGGTDASFRLIFGAIAIQTRKTASPSKPEYGVLELAELLNWCYAPGTRKKQSEPTAAAPKSRRALDTLQRNLCRATNSLARSDARVAELVAENGKLRDIIKEQEKVIEVQAAVIVELKSKCRALQGELDAARRDIKGLEQRPTKEVLGEVKEKLAEERKARRAAERRVSEMTKERTKLRRMLTLAERGFDEAEAAMEAAQAAEKLATSAKAAAQVRAAEAELQAAAQVVLAQEEAATWMAEALDEAVAAEVEKRGLRTMDETVQSVREQAAAGEFTEPVRAMTGIVMAKECARGADTTFRPDNASGKGRSCKYRKVVQSVKPSNLLSPTQLWQRSKLLMAEVRRVGGGKEGAVVQTTHLINSNVNFFETALVKSRIAPPKPVNLDQWAELGTQVSGCMGEQIRTFFRRTCGNKFPSKAQIKAHYANNHFDFHTFPYQCVETVESKVAQPDGSTKVSISKKYTNGVCGSIRSLEDVIVRMVRHHHAAGNIAYPENIPAGFVPFQICLDAGAGTTKVILKLNIVKNSDSVKNLVLLAILSKAKDTYAAMAVAFKSIFDDFNSINTYGLWVKIGWRPALPLDHTVELVVVGPGLEPRWRK